MANTVWHGVDKCAVNGARIPEKFLRTGGGYPGPCPYCGNRMSGDFDGTVSPDFDQAAAGEAILREIRRPWWYYLVAAGIFLLVNVLVSLLFAYYSAYEELTVAATGRTVFGVILGGVAVWWYLRETRGRSGN